MANGWHNLAANVEERLAQVGVEGISEKELLAAIWYNTRQPRPLLDWKPRDVAVAIITLLSAIGLASFSSATAALALLEG